MVKPQRAFLGRELMSNRVVQRLIGWSFVYGLALLGAAGCVSREGDSVKAAREANQQSATAVRLDDGMVRFLVEAADARMMDTAEGKLASTKGTTATIRGYGQEMVNEQAMLLGKIRTLAGRVGATLPTAISNSKQAALHDLQELSGADFDAKFVRLITIDHKRDVGEFEEAGEFKNVEVRRFAAEHLPMIKRHLAEIVAIHVSMK